jgi:hypothetical protein
MPDFAGNTLSTAYNLGTLGKPEVYSDWVGGIDSSDWYKFALPQTSSFRATLNGLTGNADLALYSSGGVSLVTSSAYGTNPETIDLPLASGDYYIQVIPASLVGNDSFYSLNLDVNLISDAAIPDKAGKADFTGNPFLDQSKAITLTNTPQIINDSIGYGGDLYDDYSFTLTNTSFFRATLNGRSDAVSFSVLNSKGDSVLNKRDSIVGSYGSYGPLALDSSLSAGKYVIRIESYFSSKTAYSLNVSASTIPDQAGKATFTGDSSPDQSKSIALTNIPQVINDWIGYGGDNYDDYSFTLADTSFIRANLNGRSDAVSFSILNSKGEYVLNLRDYSSGSYLPSTRRRE